MSLTVSIDEAVRSVIIQRGLSVHWYFRFLKYAIDCVRELWFDTTGIVNTKVIELPQDGVVTYPFSAVTTLSARAEGQKGCAAEFKWEKLSENKIKVKGAAGGKRVEIKYIMGGSTCDAASHIPKIALKTIESYIIWKNSYTGRDSKDSHEARIFYNEHRILRARISDLELKDLVIGQKTKRGYNEFD